MLAQGLRVDTGIFARRGNTRAKNRFTVVGGVDLSGATIKGGLMLPDANLVDDRGGMALRADHISVEGGVNLSGVTASGAVRLASARVVGPLTLSGARMGTLDVSARASRRRWSAMTGSPRTAWIYGGHGLRRSRTTPRPGPSSCA
ncbi:hypothetical protein [Streptomyces sp. NPDC056682]|uniref:hypothetical protein n=1 Tax=Streptomyces sp. NPDC056682 TaxID=3345909 RepID=UPI00369A3420